MSIPKEMKPGPELDALVAEKVMGLNPADYPREIDCGYDYGPTNIRTEYLPRYSTDIAAAWEVFLRLVGTNTHVDISVTNHYPDFLYGATVRFWGNAGEVAVDGDTVEHAICLAALKAVGE